MRRFSSHSTDQWVYGKNSMCMSKCMKSERKTNFHNSYLLHGENGGKCGNLTRYLASELFQHICLFRIGTVFVLSFSLRFIWVHNYWFEKVTILACNQSGIRETQYDTQTNCMYAQQRQFLLKLLHDSCVKICCCFFFCAFLARNWFFARRSECYTSFSIYERENRTLW